VRSDAPWTLNSGYFKNPEATAAAIDSARPARMIHRGDDSMRHAFNFKRERLEITGFEWRVVKDVEVLGAKSILLARYWR